MNRGLKPAYGVENARFCKLLFHDQFNLSNSTAPYVTKTYEMNGLFDPESGTGTHQPAQFAQLATLYRYYRVYAVKFDFVAFAKDTSVEAFMVGYTTRRSVGVPPVSITGLRERTNQRSGWKVVNHLQPVVKFKSPLLYCHNAEGLTREEYRTQAFDAPCTANPLSMPKFDIFCSTIDSTSAIISTYFDIRIVYYCKFWDPIQNTSST